MRHARVVALEAGTVCASRVTASPAGSRPPLNHDGGSVAAGSHEPGHLEDSRNVRQKGDSNQYFKNPLVDEKSRSAIMLRFPCAQNRAGVSAWFKNAEEGCDVKCESGSLSARDVFAIRALSQQVVAQHKDDGRQNTVDGVFGNTTPTIRARPSESKCKMFHTLAGQTRGMCTQ